MAERRYRARSRGQSPSPRRLPPKSRDFSPSRHRRHSPLDRPGRGGYSKGADTSRRIEKRHHFDRDSNFRAPRVSEYDNRDRGSYVVGDRRRRSPQRIRSPRRIEKRDELDRDNTTSRNVRFPDYEDAGKVKYKDGANVGHSMRSYDEGSYQWDHHLFDGPRKSDHFSANDYGQTHDYNGVGDANATGGGGERDCYPHSPYLDSGRDGFVSISQYPDFTEPVSMKYEREERVPSRSYALRRGGVDDIPVSNLSGGGGSNHVSSVVSRYLTTEPEKVEYAHLRDLEKRDGSLHDREDRYFEKKKDVFHYQDGFLGAEKRVREEFHSFKNENNLLSSQGYLKGEYDYMASSSRPRDYVSVSSGNLREGFPGYTGMGDHNMASHLSQQGSGLTSQPIVFDGLKTGRIEDTRSVSRSYIGLPEEKQVDRLFSEFGRSKIGGTSTRLHDVDEDYRDPIVARSDVFNTAVDESFNRKPLRDDGRWDPYSFSQVRSMPDELDSSRSLHARKQELDMLGSGISRLDYGIDGYFGYGSAKTEEGHARVDGGQWAHVERSDILQSRGYDPSFDRFYDSPRNTSGLVDLDEPFERGLRNKRVRDEMMYEKDVGIRISADGYGARMIYNQLSMGDEIDHFNFSKKPKSSQADYEETRRGFSDMANDRPTSSRFHPRNSDSRDIKKRLGPVPRKLHVSQRLVKKYKPSVKKRLAPAPPKKRLAPAPSKKRSSLPWMKNMSSNVTTNIQDSHDHEGDHAEDHLSHAKLEPPEKSEDFKQLVQSAFFKFLKQINETPAKRKKYLEQGKAGSLKCVVCGSNSDEFAETESLARHAFTSIKVGLRSQHLGLHKALCALMGWKIMEQPSSEWRCEVMANAEASALKQDLIIWPPLVIVYNSTIDKTNPDEQIIVSTEKLDMKLKDMGFGNIVKVCNGKPGNQSVMLVKFNGTLSGLQEAERYHKRFIDTKHGKAELKQLKSENEISTQVIEEDFLYGHLGIAEDFDKLDFDTKKRCVLRSKKDILSIVNVPPANEGENVCS